MNQRFVKGSKRIFGSLRLAEVSKKLLRSKFLTKVPSLCQIRISRFTASTMWSGPTPTWVSGGRHPPLSDWRRPMKPVVADGVVSARGVTDADALGAGWVPASCRALVSRSCCRSGTRNGISRWTGTRGPTRGRSWTLTTPSGFRSTVSGAAVGPCAQADEAPIQANSESDKNSTAGAFVLENSICYLLMANSFLRLLYCSLSRSFCKYNMTVFQRSEERRVGKECR